MMRSLIVIALAFFACFVSLEPGSAEQRISYHVINVAANDPTGLNVRSNVIEATSLKNTTIVGHLAWNAKGILSSGLEIEIAGSIWREIAFGETIGWVNAKFLSEEPGNNQPEVKPNMLRCSGTEPFWGLNMAKSPARYTGANWTDGQWVEDIKLQKLASHEIVEMGPENWIVTLKRPAADHYVRLVIQKASPMCTDAMSNLLYPYETVLLKGKVPDAIYGCCQITLSR